MNTQSLNQIFQNSKLLESSVKSNYLAYNKFCEIKRTMLSMADSLKLNIQVLATSSIYINGAIAMYISSAQYGDVIAIAVDKVNTRKDSFEISMHEIAHAKLNKIKNKDCILKEFVELIENNPYLTYMLSGYLSSNLEEYKITKQIKFAEEVFCELISSIKSPIKSQCLKILFVECIPDDVKDEIIKISSKFNI